VLTRDGRSEVGERLRDAREVRGVDLHRVERDTKIRSKYLAALEAGEFADLPGDVYARGFLRNYATYLGLDADEIEDEWRQEGGDLVPAKPVIAAPKPLTMRRKVTFQGSHVVIGVVAVIVLVVAGYFGYQLTRYLSYPTLRVVSAGASPVTLLSGTTSYVLSGTATPNTTVLIAYDGHEPISVPADGDGHWTYQAVVTDGRHQFDVTAKNLDTSHASNTVRLIVVVLTPTPTPVVPAVALVAPLDGASPSSGKVIVTGTSTLVSSVTLTPTYLGMPGAAGSTLPPPTPSPLARTTPTPAPTPVTAASGSPGPTITPPPQPLTAKTEADGSFNFSLQLKPGRWQLTVVGENVKGVKTKPVSRQVNVQFTGVNVIIQVKGGDATLSVIRDGVFDYKFAPVTDGFSTTIGAKTYVCIAATNGPDNVYFTVNGRSYGAVSDLGGSHVYIDSKGPKFVDIC
jgi:transcriptional regulator with XRE-family HTH domain